MPHIPFNFNEDFEKKLEGALSNAQLQLLKELFQKHNVDEDQLYYIMHKRPEAIGFNIGDHVLYLGYTHLRPDQKEFSVNEVIKLHPDCLTDVTIKSLNSGKTQRVYHRDLVKIKK